MAYDSADDYVSQLRWAPEPKGHGYRGVPITPAEDFATPHITDEDWDLL